MISFIRGTVADLTETSVIVESGYIGFEINMTGNALAQLHIGQEVKLHTYFQVREDAMVLYGFFNKDDLQVFKLLLGVNGVGPKAALGVLAGITADELRFAVLSDDVKTLSKAPGIGKKTAQKLILELKDKLSLEGLRAKACQRTGGSSCCCHRSRNDGCQAGSSGSAGCPWLQQHRCPSRSAQGDGRRGGRRRIYFEGCTEKFLSVSQNHSRNLQAPLCGIFCRKPFSNRL